MLFKIIFYIIVLVDNFIISGLIVVIVFDVNKNYNYICIVVNGYLVVNIVWRFGMFFGIF